MMPKRRCAARGAACAHVLMSAYRYSRSACARLSAMSDLTSARRVIRPLIMIDAAIDNERAARVRDATRERRAR